jgi:hypothetical protein
MLFLLARVKRPESDRVEDAIYIADFEMGENEKTQRRTRKPFLPGYED